MAAHPAPPHGNSRWLYIYHARAEKSFIFYIFNIAHLRRDPVIVWGDAPRRLSAGRNNRMEVWFAMGIIVCKFGGSSVADPDHFRRVRDIVRADHDRRYIVLSAPGAGADGVKITDLLERLWRGDGAALDRVVERFHTLAVGIGLPPDDERVRACLQSAARVSRAHTLSCGECLCARLFARYADVPFMDAPALVRFDEAGSLQVPQTLEAIRRAALEHPRLVIPGFYGADPEGNIAILPRNGSDITGALVAAGVGAELYENWTDVPGVMTGDPRTDPDARPIPRLSYAEMRERARRGARVLHIDCIEPLEKLGIPTLIRCTATPEAAGSRIERGY